MVQQTIVAHFDSRSEADAAAAALVSEGLSRDAIQLLPEQSSTYTRSTSETSYDHRRDEGGFWASLGNLALPDEDRYSYAEGMSRGGVTLAVSTDPSLYDSVAQLLEQYGAVDLDAREAEWRSAGWSGYASAGQTSSGGTMTTGSTAAVDTSGIARDEGVIPVVEERLAVGKQEVDRGAVRVRAYVREVPVEAEVELRATRVYIERRPVDRPVNPGEVGLPEQVIEAREHAEQPVVAKEARVVEEIGLRQETEVQHQRIQDTVRKTEVEIEDERRVSSDVEAERLRRTGPLTD